MVHADLSLGWVHMQSCRIRCIPAHMRFSYKPLNTFYGVHVYLQDYFNHKDSVLGQFFHSIPLDYSLSKLILRLNVISYACVLCARYKLKILVL